MSNHLSKFLNVQFCGKCGDNEKYLCDDCDGDVHSSGEKAKHLRVPISSLSDAKMDERKVSGQDRGLEAAHSDWDAKIENVNKPGHEVFCHICDDIATMVRT